MRKKSYSNVLAFARNCHGISVQVLGPLGFDNLTHELDRSSHVHIPRRRQRRGRQGAGAHARIRTGDLFLTKEMLYRLSYMGVTLRSSILSATNWAPECARSTR